MTDAPDTGYPLKWPAGWRRTSAAWRKSAQFSHDRKPLTVFQAVRRVDDELERMGIEEVDIVISTNLKLRRDGLPRSDQREPEDPGVAVYWLTEKGPQCMACDLYDRVADNLAAIAATLDALRRIERHGGAVILERAFEGFKALPSLPGWWIELGFETTEGLTLEQCEEAFKRLAREHHDDMTGGGDGRMASLNWARAEARKFFEGGTR